MDGLKSRINGPFNGNCVAEMMLFPRAENRLAGHAYAGVQQKITRRACAGIRRRKGDGDGSKNKKSIGEARQTMVEDVPSRGCLFEARRCNRHTSADLLCLSSSTSTPRHTHAACSRFQIYLFNFVSTFISIIHPTRHAHN